MHHVLLFALDTLYFALEPNLILVWFKGLNLLHRMGFLGKCWVSRKARYFDIGARRFWFGGENLLKPAPEILQELVPFFLAFVKLTWQDARKASAQKQGLHVACGWYACFFKAQLLGVWHSEHIFISVGTALSAWLKWVGREEYSSSADEAAGEAAGNCRRFQKTDSSSSAKAHFVWLDTRRAGGHERSALQIKLSKSVEFSVLQPNFGL